MTEPFKITETAEGVAEISVADDTEVLKSSDYRQLLSAEGLLAAIVRKGEVAREEAHKEYLHQRDQGYADGIAKAEQEAVKDAVLEAQHHQRFLRKVEAQIMTVVKDLTRKVIAEIPEEELVVKLARSALDQAVRSAQMVLRVAPQQVHYVKAAISGFMDEYADVNQIDVRGDKQLAATDCVLESFSGLIIDASLEVQLAGIEAALRTADKQPDDAAAVADSAADSDPTSSSADMLAADDDFAF